MTSEAAVTALERASSLAEGRKAVRALRADDLGIAFFRRVATLSGESPESAIRLSRFWKLVGEESGQMHYAFRARAAGERLQGKWLRSARTFVEAGEQCSDPVERLSFQAGAVDGYARAGQISEAVRLGKRLSSGLEQRGETALAARIKLNLGNALVWADDYRKAEKWLSQALPELESAGLDLEASACKLALSTAYLFGPHPLQAEPYAQDARRWFEANDFQYYADLCAINLAHNAMLRGRPDESVRLLLDLRDRMADSAVELARIEEYLGDSYLKLNLYEEAIDSFDIAARLQTGKDMGLSKAHCAFGKAHAFLGQGSYTKASRYFGLAQQGYRTVENRMWEAAAWAGNISAKRQTGRSADLAYQANQCIDSLRKVNSTYYLAFALLERARLALGEMPEAYVRQAYRLIQDHGYAAMEWEVHAVRAVHCLPQQRLKHYRKAFAAILRSRMQASSNTGRIRFLRDKGQVLSGYLDELLATPKPRRVKEAVRVITECRSAALVDEILSSNADGYSPELVRQLNELRAKLNELAPEGAKSGTERRGAMPRGSLKLLQKQWVEMTSRLLETTSPAKGPAPAQPASVFTETGTSMYRLFSNVANRIDCSIEEVANRLKWLQFEMLAPMLDPQAGAGSVEEQLRWFGEKIEARGRVSPDGLLWQVPWQAISLIMGDPEPILLANPAFASEVNISLSTTAKVCIWYLDTDQLPHIAEEVSYLLKLFPEALVCSTASQVRGALESGDFDLLHVAGHARFNAENPMFSYLEFAGGKIYANEIAKSGLRCRAVVLSACETGSLSFTFKEEPEGLTRAFLARSAQAVLASSWVVDDEAGKRFMKSLYETWISGATFIDAVRSARQSCRSWRSHPYYWAPFVVFSGYSLN